MISLLIVYVSPNSPEANAPWLLFFIAASFAYVIFFHAISQSSTADTKIFFYYSQMLIIFFGPETQWLSWMSIFDFNISQSSGGFCVMPVTPMQRLLSGVVMPIVSVFQLGIIWCCHVMFAMCCRSCRRAMNEEQLITAMKNKLINSNHQSLNNSSEMKDSHSNVRGSSRIDRQASERQVVAPTFTDKLMTTLPTKWPVRARYLRTLLALFLFTYNSIANTVLKYMDCLTIDSDTIVVASYPAISCRSDQYKSLLPMFLSLLGVVVGAAPFVLLFSLLWLHYRGRLQQHQATFGIVYDVYRDKRYWWEFVVLLRRVCLVALTVWLRDDRKTMMSMLTVANIAILCAHMIASPFATKHDNQMESLSLMLLAVVTAVLTPLEIPLETDISLALSLTVLIPSLGFIALCLWARVGGLFSRFKGNKISPLPEGEGGKKPAHGVHSTEAVHTDNVDPLEPATGPVVRTPTNFVQHPFGGGSGRNHFGPPASTPSHRVHDGGTTSPMATDASSPAAAVAMATAGLDTPRRQRNPSISHISPMNSIRNSRLLFPSLPINGSTTPRNGSGTPTGLNAAGQPNGGSPHHLVDASGHDSPHHDNSSPPVRHASNTLAPPILAYVDAPSPPPPPVYSFHAIPGHIQSPSQAALDALSNAKKAIPSPDAVKPKIITQPPVIRRPNMLESTRRSTSRIVGSGSEGDDSTGNHDSPPASPHNINTHKTNNRRSSRGQSRTTPPMPPPRVMPLPLGTIVHDTNTPNAQDRLQPLHTSNSSESGLAPLRSPGSPSAKPLSPVTGDPRRLSPLRVGRRRPQTQQNSQVRLVSNVSISETGVAGGASGGDTSDLGNNGAPVTGRKVRRPSVGQHHKRSSFALAPSQPSTARRNGSIIGQPQAMIPESPSSSGMPSIHHDHDVPLSTTSISGEVSSAALAVLAAAEAMEPNPLSLPPSIVTMNNERHRKRNSLTSGNGMARMLSSSGGRPKPASPPIAEVATPPLTGRILSHSGMTSPATVNNDAHAFASDDGGIGSRKEYKGESVTFGNDDIGGIGGTSSLRSRPESRAVDPLDGLESTRGGGRASPMSVLDTPIPHSHYDNNGMIASTHRTGSMFNHGGAGVDASGMFSPSPDPIAILRHLPPPPTPDIL
jgi:hypothetical protein